MNTAITVVYKYLAPKASSTNDIHDIPITTTTKTLTLDEMLALHPRDEIITLLANDPEEYGEGPKEYKVQYRLGPNLIGSRDHGVALWALFVIVTDPDA